MFALLSTIVGGLAGSALAMAGFRKRSDDLTDAQLARLPADIEADERLIAAYHGTTGVPEATEPAAAPDLPASVPTLESPS